MTEKPSSSETVDIKEATTPAEVLACWGPMFELNSHLVKEEFVDRVRQVKRDDPSYTLLYIEGDKHTAQARAPDNGCTPAVAIIAYRIQNFLWSGKTMILESMCTLPECRGRGYASLLVDTLKERAKLAGCEAICLDSVYRRHEAHRLYLNKGFILESHHFDLELKPAQF